ncbi:MAG TPA: ABC transporter permease [Acidimicrobiales bacterium]
MHLGRFSRLSLLLATFAGLAFLYLPLIVVAVLSFSAATTLEWPPQDFTVHWWGEAAQNQGARDALWTSVKTATAATAVALVLGTLASFAVHRFKFFGRDAISLIIILPIALPGIITGIALNAAFSQVGVELGFFTLVVAHATFCIVVVFNNVVARLRRTSTNLEEASADLGADTFQTFRYVTFPILRTALLAGALLAFGLSFDEIVVTTFTAGAGIETLPQWFFNNIFRPVNLPIVNVVATFVVLVSIIPVWAAQKLSGEATGVTSKG